MHVRITPLVAAIALSAALAHPALVCPAFAEDAAAPGAPGAPAAAPAAAATEGGEVALEYVTLRTWNLRLPKETLTAVGAGIAIPHQGGATFAARLDGTALLVDTDGDGETDARVERTAGVPVATGLVKLTGKTPGGAGLTWAARLVEDGTGWRFAASGAMTGKIGATRVRIVDQDNNGRYDDWGVDAMIVGRGDTASFLSRTVLVGGKLLAIDVKPDGSSLTWSPYAGETGVLDLAAGAATKAKVRSLIVRSEDGQQSFDLSGIEGGATVPVGAYALWSGELVLGDSALQIRRGASKAISVEKGKTARPEWGGPVRAEFEYERRGGQVGFDPAKIWWFGRLGEEYHDWTPLGKSPEFVVRDTTTTEEILRVKFPGST